MQPAGLSLATPGIRDWGLCLIIMQTQENNLMVIQTQKTDTLIDIKSCLHFLECEEKLPCFFEAPTCTT
jgi:hypothetical protein